MKPGEKDLYVFLMHLSERCCTRQITVTDATVFEVNGHFFDAIAQVFAEVSHFHLERVAIGQHAPQADPEQSLPAPAFEAGRDVLRFEPQDAARPDLIGPPAQETAVPGPATVGGRFPAPGQNGPVSTLAEARMAKDGV